MRSQPPLEVSFNQILERSVHTWTRCQPLGDGAPCVRHLPACNVLDSLWGIFAHPTPGFLSGVGDLGLGWACAEYLFMLPTVFQFSPHHWISAAWGIHSGRHLGVQCIVWVLEWNPRSILRSSLVLTSVAFISSYGQVILPAGYLINGRCWWSSSRAAFLCAGVADFREAPSFLWVSRFCGPWPISSHSVTIPANYTLLYFLFCFISSQINDKKEVKITLIIINTGIFDL